MLTDLPGSLTLHDVAYALDGGSIYISAGDESGKKYSILLVQHMIPQRRDDGPLPGRLYFEGELIPTRSDLEAKILDLLRSAGVRHVDPPSESGERINLSQNTLILGDDIREFLERDGEASIRAMRDKVVRFVESDEYLKFGDDPQRG